jgi:radical SAM protein with 4Fe4S-binding SPASM domain
VHGWLKGKNIYPIYLEIGLFGGCNHRCIFCALDFLGYKPNELNGACLRRFVLEAAKRGVKSILYSGEGEPLLHNGATDIIIFTKKAGIDVAITTNGVMFKKEMAKRLLRYISWLRVSLNAGTELNYSIIHGSKQEDFNSVINNLKQAVRVRDKNKYNCTIGVQFLLIPENYKEVTILAKLLSDTGIDYLIIKPYSQHPSSINKINPKFKYSKLFYLEEELKKYSKDNFQIIFRRQTMNKLGKNRPYRYCLGLSYASIITADGDIYPCVNFLGKKEFAFGNICHTTFRDIWEGKARKKVMNGIYTKWDIKNCREICRLDEINRYLWELKNPSEHVNFI